MKEQTSVIRHQERSHQKEHSVPIYMTSSYLFDDAEDMRATFAEEKAGNIYSRYSNPNTNEFAERVALLEGAASGWAAASGMAAVFNTFAALLSSGDHIVSCRSVFGSTHKVFTEILPKWGIHTTYVDYNDYTALEEAIQPTTKIVYLETPSNPGLDIIDLTRVGELCKQHKVIFAVDNCFATPIIQKPILFGADLVIHSATKYIDGQGRTLGGAVVGKKDLIERIVGFAKHTGPSLSPFNAWILSRSLETLALRMEKHSEQAYTIAERLEKHEQVVFTRYPFLPSHPEYALAKKQMSLGGGIVSFEIKGGIAAGRLFLDSLQLFSLSANLGDVRSIATHPASTTHSKLSEEDRQKVGISNGLIRLSIGLEDVTDIWSDIEQALTKVALNK